MRPPASPVGSVLSSTHSMNPWDGASSSILPGSEEGIGGRHALPRICAPSTPARAGKDEWRRLCQRRQQPSLRRGGVTHRAGRRPGHDRPRLRQLALGHARLGRHAGVVRHQSDRRGLPASRRAAAFHRHVVVRDGARQGGAIPPWIPKPGSRARCCRPAAEGRDAGFGGRSTGDGAHRRADGLRGQFVLCRRRGQAPDPGALAGTEAYRARIEALLSVMLQDENVRLPGYRRHDLAHRAEQQGLEVSELTMQKLGKLASKS
ncbi:MAG: (2R)-3-sulfolactate dehydrogenase [Rhodospirillaceae bacterium]|nr:(2R)-3-sulfolactate dehydrogenase [Rhodospirillaceae bacterium]